MIKRCRQHYHPHRILTGLYCHQVPFVLAIRAAHSSHVYNLPVSATPFSSSSRPSAAAAVSHA